MKKLMLIAVAAFCFAACGNSNANKEAAVETKAAHECTDCTKAEGEHKCNHAEGEHKCNHAAADSTKHECNKPADQKCDKCKQAEAAKAEQAK